MIGFRQVFIVYNTEIITYPDGIFIIRTIFELNDDEVIKTLLDSYMGEKFSHQYGFIYEKYYYVGGFK